MNSLKEVCGEGFIAPFLPVMGSLRVCGRSPVWFGILLYLFVIIIQLTCETL